MLSLIRNNVQSFFVKAIVLIVCGVMLFFGITTYQDQGVNTLAEVGGIEVKLEAYQRYYDQTAQDLRQRYGANAQRIMEATNLKQQILSQLVNNALLLKSAQFNGLAITDEELAQWLRSNPQFLTDGRFDQHKYDELLKGMRSSSAEFEAEMRQELLAQKYLNLVGRSHLVSKEYVETLYRRDQTEMTAKIFQVEGEDLKIKAQLSPEELQAYYNGHPERFQSVGAFKLNYFLYGSSDLTGQAKVSDKALELYYKKNREKLYTEKASYQSHHILIKVAEGTNPQSARDRAGALYKQLEADPKGFEKFAKSHSEDLATAPSGGDLGRVEVGHFLPQFDAQIEKLEPGQISPPFLTRFGYHIARLDQRNNERRRSFEEVKGEIEAELVGKKAQRKLALWQENATKQLASSPLSALAQGKTITETPIFDQQTDLGPLGASAPIYAEIKKKKVGDKGVMELGANLLAYEVVQVTEPKTKPFAEVKEQVALFAQVEKEKELVAQAMTKLTQEIVDPAAFDAFSKRVNKKAEEVQFFYKDQQVGKFSAGREFVQALYELEPGQARFIAQGNMGYAAILVAKTQGDPAMGATALGRMGDEFKGQKAQVLLAGLVDELRKTTPIHYNAKLMNALEITGRP
ncbi:MAG: hypothetical protein A2508_08545 [Candidatus Lambdaproteobacteria bacterium RIFOXYD12_FULL_49_8]|uniref:Periplasmic chaperone PpiD n=1 Tax=Candidatus Lambdaproteobacteria bacterium RIFOXYD2_FULL_50_16 TaxID=1817772 RepID=A0A1F6G6H9_9PROT|nr:MAG: hypothetical protein A2527_11370 [Candidatus Lambdaproteobacteria bacterium RIFOXYD2_FULL_50_16]OGG96513.1 MAG: hypothetical protein A2508_08545 [Candidatus Lambdaproteobacteria bacterium RIFOXYD12_FULL_49_8]